MLTMGIDSGSAMTKAVLFDGQEIVDFRMEPSGSTPGRVIHRLYEELRTPDTAFVVAGRCCRRRTSPSRRSPATGPGPPFSVPAATRSSTSAGRTAR